MMKLSSSTHGCAEIRNRTKGSAPAKARVCSGPSGPACMCLLQRAP